MKSICYLCNPDIIIEASASILKWFNYPKGRRTASNDLNKLINQYYFEN
jgi:hypothetical protein